MDPAERESRLQPGRLLAWLTMVLLIGFWALVILGVALLL